MMLWIRRRHLKAWFLSPARFPLSTFWKHSKKVATCKTGKGLALTGEMNQLAPWTRTSQLQLCEKQMICCLRHPDIQSKSTGWSPSLWKYTLFMLPYRRPLLTVTWATVMYFYWSILLLRPLSSSAPQWSCFRCSPLPSASPDSYLPSRIDLQETPVFFQKSWKGKPKNDLDAKVGEFFSYRVVPNGHYSMLSTGLQDNF